MKRIILLIGMLAGSTIGFVSCKQSNPEKVNGTGVDTSAVLAAVDSLGRVVQKAHDTRDDKLLASTWAKDGILIVAGSAPVHGRDSIVSKLKSMPSLPPGGEMKINILEVQVLSSEWAYVLGTDSLKYTPGGSTTPVSETSSFFVLVRRTPEGWQTFRETLSPNQQARR